jgi:hypothetical protein
VQSKYQYTHIAIYDPGLQISYIWVKTEQTLRKLQVCQFELILINSLLIDILLYVYTKQECVSKQNEMVFHDKYLRLFFIIVS